MSFSLTTQFSQQYTYIPNAFIDTYMPEANGSFVKVYLYLLRQMGTATPVLTIEMMADMLSNTEADILRALRYWKKQGLLEIEEKDGEITHLCLLPLEPLPAAPKPASHPAAEFSASTEVPASAENVPAELITPAEPTASGTSSVRPAAPAAVRELPPRQNYTPLMAEALKKDLEINSCLNSVESLLGTTMSDAHMQLILYLMSDLGFSRELILTLYETALARDKRSSRYIEAIALDWAKRESALRKRRWRKPTSFTALTRLSPQHSASNGLLHRQNVRSLTVLQNFILPMTSSQKPVTALYCSPATQT